ncbi:hypothetical protein [Methanoculleus bourgensis]|nr:hypothetical protein [Methanoculleus bourgensis]
MCPGRFQYLVQHAGCMSLLAALLALILVVVIAFVLYLCGALGA